MFDSFTNFCIRLIGWCFKCAGWWRWKMNTTVAEPHRHISPLLIKNITFTKCQFVLFLSFCLFCLFVCSSSELKSCLMRGNILCSEEAASSRLSTEKYVYWTFLPQTQKKLCDWMTVTHTVMCQQILNYLELYKDKTMKITKV